MRQCRVVLVLMGLVASLIVSSAAAAAASPVSAHVRAPKTTVTRLTASPPTLTAAGGSLILASTVSDATSCTFTGKTPKSATPATGLPETVPCSTGTVSTTVTVPPNPCCTERSYRFAITVTGTRTKTSSVVVKVPPHTTTNCYPNPGGGLDLSGCDFSGQDLSGSFFPDSDFTLTILTGTNLSSSEFSQTSFGEASAVGADFDESDLAGAAFYGANLTDATFVGSVLTATDFTRADLTGATIEGVVSTVVWNYTICPDGTNSNADGGTCLAHLTP